MRNYSIANDIGEWRWLIKVHADFSVPASVGTRKEKKKQKKVRTTYNVTDGTQLRIQKRRDDTKP
jgi:hypothetical protein